MRATTARVLAVVATTAALGVGLVTPAAAQSPGCFGRTVTIAGTAGSDTLRSRSGRVDVIDGRGGDDLVYADEGDFVCGGSGDDILYGANDNDSGPGNVTMSGGDGADVIKASRYGGDALYGGPGDDAIYGANSGLGPTATAQYRTRMYGQTGDDLLYSNRHGNTYMDGGFNHDSCYVRAQEAGPNTIVGCEGPR